MKIEIDRVCTQGDLARMITTCNTIKDDLIRINDLIVRGSTTHLDQNQDECMKLLTETSRLCSAVAVTMMNERLKSVMRMGL